MTTEVIQLYEDRSYVTLTTYILSDSQEMLKGRKRPGILICPGGAYLSCSDREGESIAMKFAAMGYHAFVLRYSVYNEGNMAFPDPSTMRVKPQLQHPTPMREIGMAMLEIKKHSNDWLVDDEKIGICGFSAGGHNVTMYATNYHKPIITDYLKATDKELRPAVVIAGYPLTDYVFMKEQARTSTDPMAKVLFEMSNTSFLGTTAPSDELLIEVSPARNVSAMTPPAFLWTTAADALVPAKHTVLFAAALCDHHIPYELHVFEEGQHGLSTATQASAGAKSEIDVNAASWMKLCEKWLQKRFAFDLPEKSLWEI